MSRETCSFFMFKIIIICFLILSIACSYDYLQTCLKQRQPLSFHPDPKTLLIQKKEIILNEQKDFDFNDYFSVLAFQEYSCSYEFTDDTVVITLDGNAYEYPYRIREKEKEIVEVTVYKEVYHENPEPAAIPSAVSSQMNLNEEHYLHLHRSSFSYPVNTEISQIIGDLSSCFDSNANVMIDFSQLNSSANGSYPVYFRYDDEQKEIIVHIT